MDTRKTILVVDDDSLVLESILLLLAARDGFKAIPARGAADALAHLHASHAIDIVIADVVLAGPQSGFDICRHALESHPDIAIVVITADTEVHYSEVPDRGVFLRKPFGAETLLAAIDEAQARVDATGAA